MKRPTTLLASVLLTLCFGVGQAAAEESPGGADQAAGQSAASGQHADGDGDAYQSGAANRMFDIRVLSPGSSGDVTQSNTTTGFAIAKNDNDTSQTTDQSQTGGGPGSDSTQIAGQEATSAQKADADATAKQIAPTNEAFSIRVLSPGSSGDVTQSNSATAGAIAKNDNDTSQTTDQSQTGGGHGSDSTQIAGQDAANRQDADADAKAVQLHPSNTAVSIRVLSPGRDGDVTQSNSTTAIAAALNDNETKQSIDQSQGSAAAPAKAPESSREMDAYKGGSDGTQIAGQKADNRQKADADATAVQVKPSNKAVSIRVLSPGEGGDVTQSNDATAVGIAKNDNKTRQSIDQSQGSPAPTMVAPENGVAKSGYGDKQAGSTGTQIAGQEAGNHQSADADAKAVQIKPSNTATSIRVLSPGDDGDVTQSNDATAVGIAKNDNTTKQSIDQSQTGGYGSDYTQIAGQKADSKQKADADATAVQLKPSNTAGSIRVLSPGHDGDVTQSNSTTAIAAALNDNETKQSIDQIQGSSAPMAAPEKDGYKDDKDGRKKDGSDYTQIAGQEAGNEQKADADATAVQVKPSNTAASIRVLSPGKSGDVTQSNDATAVGIAKNDNDTKQFIDQTQGGGYGSDYLQVAGQKADNHQKADADAFALQVKPSNVNAPVRVLSKGDDGDVTQSNSTTAIAAALNDNDTKQSIDQSQTGGRGHGSDYVQVAGQGSWSRQSSDADAAAIQLGASNVNAPVREGSPGGGSVEQSNSVGALALALNTNTTRQRLTQAQTGYGSLYLQVGGQGSWTDQRGGAMSLGIQGGMHTKKKR